jgi:hypothetical protein
MSTGFMTTSGGFDIDIEWFVVMPSIGTSLAIDLIRPPCEFRALRRSSPGQSHPVAMSERRFGLFHQAAIFQEASCVVARTILVGKVRGEQQPISTNNGSSTLQEVRKEHAARSDIEIPSQVGCNRLGQSGYAVHRS